MTLKRFALSGLRNTGCNQPESGENLAHASPLPVRVKRSNLLRLKRAAI